MKIYIPIHMYLCVKIKHAFKIKTMYFKTKHVFKNNPSKNYSQDAA